MRAFLIFGLSIFLLVAPRLSHADGTVETVTKTVKDNPGKSVGVAGCAALIIFPPAAAWCAAMIIVGATYDGDTQEILKDITK